MRYTKEFKEKCVRLYRQGKWAEKPDGVSVHTFHDTIREWDKLEKAHGLKALQHSGINKQLTPEKKLKMVSRVLSGEALKAVAIDEGISGGLLCNWVKRYKLKGYEGLVAQKRGRPPKEPLMKKKVLPAELTPSEREEMVRLRAENEYLRAENEVIKKEIALREAKWDEQLKARKQRSSTSSVKKASH